MTRLTLDTWTLPGSALGPANPFAVLHPPFGFASYLDTLGVDDNVPEYGRRYLKYGVVASPLPYPMQDSYGRERQDIALKTAVLENDQLRATFLVGLGGRLWSLYHKSTDSELLYQNPVFQTVNIALRNAWFSGGVEWNFGVPGHSPLTCAPLHVARVASPDGTPVLRMYEYERIRGMVYQVDFHLPPDAEFLFMHVRLVNPHNEVTPTYWWSNIAVPERPEVRVLAPARRCFHFGYLQRIQMVDVPHDPTLGFDNTYATNSTAAGDFFYDLADTQRPWLTALDEQGVGLVQASTMRLRGRKLFVWGMGAGGRRWQQWLSEPGHPYIEIQAGLAHHQAECLPMPPGAQWEWLEAYGRMEADPRAVHGDDWGRATGAVETILNERLPQADLEARLRQTAEVARQQPQEVLQHGSGWGWLEQRRRQAQGQGPLHDAATPFEPAAVGPAEGPWRALLETGAMPEIEPGQFVGGYLVEPAWRNLLQAAVSRGGADHWLGRLLLGVAAYANEDRDQAELAWNESLARRDNAWARRNLALLAQERGRTPDVVEHMAAAWRLQPSQALAIEYTQALVACQAWDRLEAAVATMPAEFAVHGRVQLALAQAALQRDDLDRLAAILEDLEVVDIRECETTLTDLWFELHERRLAGSRGVPIDDALRREVRRQYPPPTHLEFRMGATDEPA